jgi:DNA replication and repair protein RecF
MYVQHLALTHVRNYTRLELPLQARVHVFRGGNAQGKTNLLEAIYYLATTRSPLASSERQLIQWSASAEPIPYARAEVHYVRGGEEHTIEITLVLEPQQNGATELALRRQIKLDGTPRRAMDVVGRLNIVLFLPQDVALVDGAPSERRRYLDVALCQIDPQYCRALSRYGRVLTQRNALLNALRDQRGASPGQLEYWDSQLVELGVQVLGKRLWAVAQLNTLVEGVQRALTGGRELLTLNYQSTVPLEDAEDPASLTASLTRALHAARRKELARGVTTLGPHRDDMRFMLNGVDATIYGSRGQQRTAALAIKLAEMTLMKQQTGEMPVLLLDDVTSELDAERCAYLLERVAAAEQVLLTTTDLHALSPLFLERAQVWQVLEGEITPADAE